MFKKWSKKNNLNDDGEKRRHLRETECKMLRLQPLDAEEQPSGTAFWAFSKDFSEKGFAFQFNEYVDFSLLAVSIVEEDFEGAARVQHVSRNHGQEFAFTVGCELIRENADGMVCGSGLSSEN